ncbi:hypothetical protein ACJX0J_031232, partial [Zea mays]
SLFGVEGMGKRRRYPTRLVNHVKPHEQKHCNFMFLYIAHVKNIQIYTCSFSFLYKILLFPNDCLFVNGLLLPFNLLKCFAFFGNLNFAILLLAACLCVIRGHKSGFISTILFHFDKVAVFPWVVRGFLFRIWAQSSVRAAAEEFFAKASQELIGHSDCRYVDIYGILATKSCEDKVCSLEVSLIFFILTLSFLLAVKQNLPLYIGRTNEFFFTAPQLATIARWQEDISLCKQITQKNSYSIDLLPRFVHDHAFSLPVLSYLLLDKQITQKNLDSNLGVHLLLVFILNIYLSFLKILVIKLSFLI